jgi:hypothetical protein
VPANGIERRYALVAADTSNDIDLLVFSLGRNDQVERLAECL